ncbi:MAG: Hsp20 family protein [Rhizobiales bacterium]|nr:Hsp20 family protein [Hyphomicrobiales bacterium]
MRAFDLSPLYKNTIGFDRLGQLMDQVSVDSTNGYPPYNIERLGEHEYRITMAVSGFGESDIEIEVKEDTLNVSGKQAPEAEERDYLYQGIAARAFERRFRLADHVQVNGARLENGLLHIDLVREIPEALKPRKIEIDSGKVIESKVKAA